MCEISDILRRYPADCRPTHVEPLGSAGGMSGAQFWRVVAPRGALVVRRWPREHPKPEDLRFIHAVLAHAARRGLAILPVPIAATDGMTFLHEAGHLWELTPWLAGIADYERSPSTGKLCAAMAALAEFHNAVADFSIAGDRSLLAVARVAGAAPAIVSRLTRLRDLQTGGLATFQHAITPATWPELAPLARQFLAAVPTAIPKALLQLAPLADVPLPLQPCIRDVWHDHVLFEGNCVTGLIDFGAMQVDTPATDIARLLGSLVGDDDTGRREGLAAYERVRRLMPDEIRALEALDVSGTILAGCNWIRWIYAERRTFENHVQIESRFAKLVRRVSVMQLGANGHEFDRS